jgi:hypothetical protein
VGKGHVQRAGFGIAKEEHLRAMVTSGLPWDGTKMDRRKVQVIFFQVAIISREPEEVYRRHAPVPL